MNDLPRLDAVTLDRVDFILEQRREEPGALIPILQDTQNAYGYLPRPALARIAQRLDIPFSQVYGVATFYSQFYLARRGRNVIKVCDGTACHVKGAPNTIDLLTRRLGIQPGGTTQDYQFTFEVVYCLGACALAPVAVVNGVVRRRSTAGTVQRIVESIEESEAEPARIAA